MLRISVISHFLSQKEKMSEMNNVTVENVKSSKIKNRLNLSSSERSFNHRGKLSVPT